MNSRSARPAEAHRFHPVADVLGFRKDPLGLMMEGMRQADRVTYRLGPFRAILANRVEDIEHVLVKNHGNYVKGMNYEPLKLTLGEGLLTSEGELWRNNRKMIQPAFHHRSLEGFVNTMTRCTADMLDRWETEGSSFDLHEEMVRLTFRIVGLTLFSADVEVDAEHIGPSLAFLLDWSNERIGSTIRWPVWLPIPSNRKFHEARRGFDELVAGIVNERRRTGESKGDLLDMLLAAEPGLTDKQLRDELITLAAAGHETTANALSWIFMLICKHPEVEQQLVEEGREVSQQGPVTLSRLNELEVTTRVVEEGMRLYPPAWAFERQAVGADDLQGTKVHKNNFVMMVPYTLHRDPLYWPDPERFDPDRFLPEAKQSRPRFAYLPFGGGPRICIGKSFAMMEAKLIVAAVLERFELKLAPGHEQVKMAPSITLRPKDGLQIQRRLRPKMSPAHSAIVGSKQERPIARDARTPPSSRTTQR